MKAFDYFQLAGFGLVIPLLPFFAQAFDAPAWQVTLMFSAFVGFLGIVNYAFLLGRVQPIQSPA